MSRPHPLFRSRQMFIAAFMRIVDSKGHPMIGGRGSLMALPGAMSDRDVSHALLVTTPRVLRSGGIDGFLSSLEEHGIEVTVFDGVVPDPTSECIRAAADLYRGGGCDSLVAIGGGSSIDCAKAAGALISRPGRDLEDMEGAMKVGRRIPPLFAVPTTAGAGSEVTSAAVVSVQSDGFHRKIALGDIHLIPCMAVLDPDLTMSMPPSVTAASGLDALTHVVEACTNRFTSSSIRDCCAGAVSDIFTYLPRAYADGNDAEARERMLTAAYNGGRGINSSFVGYAHALAHAVGGRYGVVHGKAVSVILPYVLEEYGKAVWDDLAYLAEAIGAEGDGEEARAASFIASMRDLNRRMGMPEVLDMIRPEDVTAIVESAIGEANPMYPVPVILDRERLSHVLTRAAGIDST